MNRIPYNSKVIVWAVAFIGIVFSAFGDQRSGKSDIPISFEIDGGNSNSVALKVFNTSEKKITCKTNLKEVLESRFLKFPTTAGIQFRESSGKRIWMMSQSQDGWWYPRRFSSFIDVNESQRLEELIDLTIKKNEIIKYPIELQDVIVLANTSKSDSNIAMTDIRIQITVTVSGVDGVGVKIPITSPWIPVSKSDKESSVN